MKVLHNKHNLFAGTAKCKWIHKWCCGIRNKLELAVGVKCTNCTQGAIVRRVSHELCPIQVNGNTLEFVVKFCYLGDMFCSGDGAEEAFRMRGREVNVHLVSVENLPEGTGTGHCRFSWSK